MKDIYNNITFMGFYDINKLFGSGTSETLDVYEAMSERFLKSNELGITPRMLSYYKTQGLFFRDTDYQKHDHIVFNFIEYVWFQIILVLRRFDIGLSIIKEVKEVLDTSIPFDEFMKEAKHSEKLLRKLPDDVREEFLEMIHGDFDWKQLERDVPMNLLALLLAEAIVKRKHVALMVTQEGEVFPFSLEDLNELNQDDSLIRFLEKTYVSISLTEVIKKSISDFDLKVSSNKLLLINEREAQVIKLLHDEKLESLKVHLDSNNTIELIEATETYNKLDKESRLMDLIIKSGYQTIELKTQDGRIVHCKNIRKIKPT
jgi:DNA-binding transcriptional MerR regulator